MAISKIQKEEIMKLLEEVASNKTVLFLSTEGTKANITAEQNTDLRKRARGEGVKVKYVKNTLLGRAFEGIEGLSGQTIIAYAVNSENEEEVTVPKAVVKLVKDDFKDSIKVIGAVVNGNFMDEAKAKALSEVPTFSDSMAMVAGNLSQVIAKIAILTKEVPTSVGRAVKAMSDKKS